MKKIECVVFDWAGTTVDYGCFAPVAAFVKAFQDQGIDISIDDARGPMGMTKIDHIRELFKLDYVTAKFKELFDRDWTENDVVEMNQSFEKYLFASLNEYTEIIPGALDCIAALRTEGIKIGSTTGYTSKMMKVVTAGAKRNGYEPDCVVTSNDLPAGRPYPFMIYKAITDLVVSNSKAVIKVGDTISDIKEGVNAGVYSVGIILGSNEMGLTLEQTNALSAEKLADKMSVVKERFIGAGADYVLNSISELPELVAKLNN